MASKRNQALIFLIRSEIFLQSLIYCVYATQASLDQLYFSLFRVLLRRFRDPIRVPGISNRVPRIRENYHRFPKITENLVPRIREIGEIASLQSHTGYLTFSLKKLPYLKILIPASRPFIYLSKCFLRFRFVKDVSCLHYFRVELAQL